MNIHEKYQVEYWTKALGVSEEKLKELVAKYGVVAVNIRGARRMLINRLESDQSVTP